MSIRLFGFRLAVVAREIRAIRRAHHAVAESIRAGLELDRDEALAHARLVEATAVPEHVVHHPQTDDLRQVLVQDEPVVVPRRHLPRVGERRGTAVAVVPCPVDGVVVEQDEGALQPCDHHLLVVARVGDDRGVRPVVDARQILEEAAEADAQLVPVRRVVQLRACDGAGAVQGVEVQRRRPGVHRVGRVGGHAQRRAGVERDVVVDELSEERRARGLRRVVAVVRAEAQVRDQQNRSFAEIVGGVEQSARLAEVGECLLHLIRRGGKRP